MGRRQGARQEVIMLGCCRSPHTKRCCYATVGLGGVFLLAGIVLLVAGPSMLEKKILATMALSPGSDRLQSWLVPPVQAHLTGYAFHVVNPEEVQQGGKPFLQEVGPFVYKAVNVKDDGWTKATSVQVMKKTGLGTPFITVSFSGLL